MRTALFLLIGVVLLPVARAEAAPPVLHAHRGGAISFGVPDQYEDTLPAFQRRVAETPGVWLEMDSLVSKDGVPYVIHDSSLNRTTDCTGNVIDKTAAEIDACRVDLLGVASDNPATSVPAPADGPVVRVPRLADVLAFAKGVGAPVNLEIKRIPGDPGYTPGDTAFATKIMDVVKAAHLDPSKLIIQSFDTTNLDVAKAVLPGVTLSYLILSTGADNAALSLCAARGYAYLSPGGVPTAAEVAQAKALGVKLVPYTLDTEANIKAAAANGVDAIITNDIPLARRALGLSGTTGASGPTGASGSSGGTGGTAGSGPTDSGGSTGATDADGAGAAGSGGGTGGMGTAGPAGSVGPAGPTKIHSAPAAAGVRLRILGHSRAATARLKGIAVKLTGAKGTTADVRVTSGTTLVAQGRITVGVTRTSRARVPLTRAGRRLLGRVRHVTLAVRTRIGPKTATQRLRLR